jgi:predicted MFS family arabinose efflux permease
MSASDSGLTIGQAITGHALGLAAAKLIGVPIATWLSQTFG